jgi:hypothetical protein
MAATKRSDFEIEHHRREIARLYLQRQPQHVIAGALGIPRSIVAYDLGVIQKQWRAETTIDLDARKAEELARLDALEREYWRAWEASHDPWEEPLSAEAYDGELALKRAQKAAAGKRGAHRTGFSGYLEGVERCIDQRCKLLGLYPVKPQASEGGGHTVIVFETSIPGLDARADRQVTGAARDVLHDLLEGEVVPDGDAGTGPGDTPYLSAAAEPEAD